MSFVGLSGDEEQRMLKAIGVASFEELLAAVPRKARLPARVVPRPFYKGGSRRA